MRIWDWEDLLTNCDGDKETTADTTEFNSEIRIEKAILYIIFMKYVDCCLIIRPEYGNLSAMIIIAILNTKSQSLK